MSLQQIIVEDSTKAESLTFQSVNEHLLLGSCTGCPFHLIHDCEELIDILDTILTIVPYRHGVVVGSPGTRCHIQVIAGFQVGDSIICGYVGNGCSEVGKTVIAIHQQAMSIF